MHKSNCKKTWQFVIWEMSKNRFFQQNKIDGYYKLLFTVYLVTYVNAAGSCCHILDKTYFSLGNKTIAKSGLVKYFLIVSRLINNSTCKKNAMYKKTDEPSVWEDFVQ